MNIKGTWIHDDEGRALILRGCNLGGSTKIPPSVDLNADWTGNSTGGSRGVSFIGKPFPLEEAEDRFAELARWGLRFNRLVIPWEAIEHDGPGIYDEAYLAWLRKLLLIAEKHGVSLWIDPHQDIWGRAAGGDGAPSWTLEKLGVDLTALEAAGAILPRSITGTVPPDRRFLMNWPAGDNRYAAATMWTLFFAGRAFAPDLHIDEDGQSLNIQDWLQTRYIEAFAHAQRRLKNCSAIAGWGTMNEPHMGFIGCTNLLGLENNAVAVGLMPSPFAAMAAASGWTMEFPIWSTGITGVKQKGKALINPDKVSIFRKGFTCPWKAAGIWDDADGAPRLVRPDHFASYKGRKPRFTEDFLGPFFARFSERLGKADEKTFFFIESVPIGVGTGEDVGEVGSNSDDAAPAKNRLVNGFHWYDGPVSFTKQFRPWFTFDIQTKKIVLGEKAVSELYRRQIAAHISKDIPSLVGEFGLSFDIFKGKAFKSGDYSLHEKALDMYYNAMDSLLLGACVWDYSADNTFRWGDSWNNEDFSIVTRGDGKGPLRPRAEGGWLRPYPLATAGIPLFFKWDRKNKSLCFRYAANPAITAPTLLFIPESLWEKKPRITGTAGLRFEQKPDEQLLLAFHGEFSGEAEIRVEAK